MPEAKAAILYSYSPDPPKKSPIIKVSCGIGDTDGFPAFDVDSDAYASKDDPKWGFLITGGAEFHMPLTVFQVTPDGLADKAGIRLGDIILEINEEDCTQLTLTQAHDKINAAPKKIHFLVKSMEDEENLDGYEPGEEKSIVLRVPKPMEPLKEFTPTALLGSRVWHPIMWHDPPEPPKPKKKKTKTEIDEEGNEVVIELSEDESSDEEEEELPHHRIIRNIRRFFDEVGDNHELRSRTIEDMLLALPLASIEARLLEMQRKLSEIAEIPKILSSTLATVSQTFVKLMPPTKMGQQHRKLSYDEDAIDYELSDGEVSDDGDEDNERDEDVDSINEVENDDENEYEETQVQRSVRAMKQQQKAKVKDVTPESDYASESNYAGNKEDEYEAEADEDEDETETEDEEGEEQDQDDAYDNDFNDDSDVANDVEDGSVDDYNYVVNFVNKLPAVSHKPNNTAVASEKFEDDDNEELEEHEKSERSEKSDKDAEEDEEDFLSTSYTWSLRNMPKLRLNEREYDRQLDNTHNEHDIEDVPKEEKEKIIIKTQQVDVLGGNKNFIDADVDGDDAYGDVEAEGDDEVLKPPQRIKAELTEMPEKQHKLVKLERFWPWADREKIIYKQSTCHLVPRKPLGLVEQRIQLLAKQHLLENLQRMEREKLK